MLRLRHIKKMVFSNLCMVVGVSFNYYILLKVINKKERMRFIWPIGPYPKTLLWEKRVGQKTIKITLCVA